MRMTTANAASLSRSIAHADSGAAIASAPSTVAGMAKTPQNDGTPPRTAAIARKTVADITVRTPVHESCPRYTSPELTGVDTAA